MELYTTKYYNPFFVTIGSKSYELCDIKFFDVNGNICQTNSGWFGCGSNNRFDTLTIDVECVLKRKVDYNCKTAFVICSGERSWDGNSKYILYIPASVVGLQMPIIARRSDRYAVVRWLTKIDGVYCEKWHFVDKELTAVENEINNVGKKISNLYQSSYDSLPTMIDLLSKLQVERESLVEKIKNIKDDEILALYV